MHERVPPFLEKFFLVKDEPFLVRQFPFEILVCMYINYTQTYILTLVDIHTRTYAYIQAY